MSLLIPILLPLIIGTTVVIFFLISRQSKNRDRQQPKNRDRDAIIREANKRLAQNPKDADALLSLAALYYREQNFDKAMKTYSILIELCATNPQLDEFEITLKHALSAMKQKQYDIAYKSLVIARTMKKESFEVNFNLGYLEFLKKNYEKAVALLRSAREIQPEDQLSQRYLGHSLYKIKKYKEAIPILRKVLDLEPEDKESLFALAQCYYELGQNDQAIKVFTHLRTDPDIGPSAALFAGTIHLNNKQHQAAIMDYEIGLRHQNIKPATALEMKYRLAAAYIKHQQIGKAVQFLNEIQEQSPGYKDVPYLLKKYGELNSNRNLQIYLISPPSEFAALCRKLVEQFFPKTRIKIIDITMEKTEYADILTEISTPRWEDTIIFRFIRTTGQVGELWLRDLYSRLKEVKAGRGFCVTAGSFSEGAQEFVEARLIDLVEKKDLMKMLNSLTKSQVKTF